jgi:hypothetical protein
MKKITFIFCSLICLVLFFIGCKNQNFLQQHVSELRSDVFYGQSENFSVKAGYGFKETPYHNDGVARSRQNLLTFKLLNKETEDTTYSLTLNFSEMDYKTTFKLSPITHTLTATLEIDAFNLKEFSVTISNASHTETVTLVSQLPENTIDYVRALDYLQKNQTELIKRYTDSNGNFQAEIYARVLVKDNKSYWYIGIASGNENLKALLIDGITGEVLAIREIF